MLNVVDGCLPADLATGDDAQVEEERRLFYVGLTRARHHLQLLVPLRFHVTQQHRAGDRHLWGGRSRFITPRWPAASTRSPPRATPSTPPSRPLRWRRPASPGRPWRSGCSTPWA